MTTEDKRKALRDWCRDDTRLCESCLFENKPCNFYCLADDEINKAYDEVFPIKQEPHIKDSGERREFDTGAVRDIQEGKGRCDLLPLDVVYDKTLSAIERFKETGEEFHLQDAMYEAKFFPDFSTMLLEVSKHFEEGAKKYGEHNWQKGIPTKCYIDSAVRHYLKHLRGDKDEPHDRAFIWNILCCAWTCKHMAELNDYPLVQNNNENEE